MSNLSEFYLRKSRIDQRLEIMKEIVVCEKILTQTDIRVVTQKGCVNATDISDSIMNEFHLSPEASNKLYKSILPAIEKYLEELKKLLKEVELIPDS